MSFRDLRQTVLRAHVLNTDRFAEEVTITAADGSEGLVTVRAKIEHWQSNAGRKGGGNNDERMGTFDERERIQVTVSRDATWAFAYVSRPLPACALYRSEERDADRRPYTFRGEVVFEGDQHAVYVFERPRRTAQGRGT